MKYHVKIVINRERRVSANIIIHSLMSNCQRRKQLPFTVKQLQTIQDNNDYVHSMILLNIRGYSIHEYVG